MECSLIQLNDEQRIISTTFLLTPIWISGICQNHFDLRSRGFWAEGHHFRDKSMVRLISVAFFLSSICCYAQHFETKITSDHIRIDQVGPRDATLEAIIITTKKLELPFPERPIEVRKNIFESLSNYVDKAHIGKTANLLRERELNEFGIFKVTKRVGNKTEIYFTGTRKKAVDFLNGFKKLLKKLGAPGELINKNERVLKRIDYLRSPMKINIC